MRSFRPLALLLAITTAATACADTSPSGPAAAANQEPSTKPATDTIKAPPSIISISGRVLGVDAVNGSGSDTLHFTPLAGANVKLWRNVLVNGEAKQVLVGEATTDAKGVYRFDNQPGGYYIAAATAPVGSVYGGSYSYVAGTSTQVVADIYLWRSR